MPTFLDKGQDGLVDIFNNDGTLFKHDAVPGHCTHRGRLRWLPDNFGTSNAILIGNNSKDGRINAFDPDSGMFLGTLTDASGQPIVIDQLWGLDFWQRRRFERGNERLGSSRRDRMNTPMGYSE